MYNPFLTLIFSVLVHIAMAQCDSVTHFNEDLLVARDSIVYYRIACFKDGEIDGDATWYYLNGKIHHQESYNKGKLVSKRIKWYYPDGKIMQKIAIRNDGGTIINSWDKDGTPLTVKGNGFYKRYYLNGNKEVEGRFSDYKRDGKWVFWNSKGNIQSELSYRNGLLEGTQVYYYNNGDTSKLETYKYGLEEGSFYTYANHKISSITEYKHGKKHGAFIKYWENGVIKRKEEYVDGMLQGGYCYGHNGQDTTYYPTMTLPRFPGGHKSVQEFLIENIIYPMEARKKGIEGKVTLSFDVDEVGKVIDIKVLKGRKELNEEAIRVIKLLPDWIPGSIDGKNAKIKQVIAVNFKLR